MSGNEGFTQLAPIDLNSGSLGAGGILIEAPQYHEYVKGRYQKNKETFFERLCFECGVTVISGNLLGLVYGLGYGYRNRPRGIKNYKLTINSLLNGAGRFSSRTGSFLGVFAILYRFSRRTIEYARGKNDKWNDIGSIALAGGLSGLPRGPFVSGFGAVFLGGFGASYIFFKSFMEERLEGF